MSSNVPEKYHSLRLVLRALGPLGSSLAAGSLAALGSLLAYLLITYIWGGFLVRGVLISVVIPLVIAPMVGYFGFSLLQSLDLTEERLRWANLRLRELAAKDELTQIANRRHFQEHLAQEWRRQRREGGPLSLIMCDMDGLKSHNDQHGHQAGDLCLRAVATLLQQNCHRPADLAARYGGDEFVIVLPNTDAAGALRIAERIRLGVDHLGREVSPLCMQQGISLSLGVASTVPSPDFSPEKLMSLADQALYQAKEAGGDMVCCLKQEPGGKQSSENVDQAEDSAARSRSHREVKFGSGGR